MKQILGHRGPGNRRAHGDAWQWVFVGEVIVHAHGDLHGVHSVEFDLHRVFLFTGGGDAQGLADYGRRIAGWAKRLRDLGTASNADEQTYVLELTQFGEINLNGAPLNQR